MKLPFGKFDWKSYGKSEILVIFFTVVVAFIGKLEPLSFEWFLSEFGIFMCLSVMIFLVYMMNSAGNIFRIEVKHPVDPNNLNVGQIYWLNGETHAVYRGQDSYSGKYKFNIYGIGKDINDPERIKDMVIGEVKKYISMVQESSEQETQTVS